MSGNSSLYPKLQALLAHSLSSIVEEEDPVVSVVVIWRTKNEKLGDMVDYDSFSKSDDPAATTNLTLAMGQQMVLELAQNPLGLEELLDGSDDLDEDELDSDDEEDSGTGHVQH